MIESALYGRMKPGKCITKEEGNFGCFSDAKSIIDFYCSGRPTCSLSPLNRDLVATKPCPGSGTIGYITVSHRCISGISDIWDNHCNLGIFMKLPV